jgi:AcrR family transcriptional regulator
LPVDKPSPPNSGTPAPRSPLPRGRSDLEPGEVGRHQRDRIVATVAAVIADHGYGGLTIARIIAGARISRTTFYGHFTDKREALVAAYDVILGHYLATVEEACNAQADWPEKVKAGIGATVRFAQVEPAYVQLLASAFLAADRELARRLQPSYEQLVALLAAGRLEQAETEALPPFTEQALVGAIAAILARTLPSEEFGPLVDVESQLSEFVLMPYLGPAGARRAVASG